jgi:hypothetical protein
MKTQTKHRIRIVVAIIPITFLVITSSLADEFHDWAFWYLGASNRTLERLSEWIVGDDLERWMGLWEKRLRDLDPDRITLAAVATAMNTSEKMAARLCRDATRQGFFTQNADSTYRLAR